MVRFPLVFRGGAPEDSLGYFFAIKRRADPPPEDGRLHSLNLPVAALLAAALIWGVTFPLVKTALLDVDAISFLGMRFAVALVVLAVAFAGLPRRQEILRMRPAEWAMGAVAGAALYGGFLFQTLGLRTTTAANSAFITGLCVVMVPFLMWAGGKPPRLKHTVGAAIAALGLWGLTGADFAGVGRGDLLTLVCALMFALHIICLGTFGKRVETLRFFCVQLLSASALAAAGAFLWGGPVRWSAGVAIALLVTGVFATTGAFFLQTWAQRRLEPSRASIWILTEPLFALGFGAILLGEFPGPAGLAGAALILTGVWVVETGGRLAPGMIRPATPPGGEPPSSKLYRSAPTGDSSSTMESGHVEA
jgi:drug/metabolite transporter (DMT)-like permease